MQKTQIQISEDSFKLWFGDDISLNTVIESGNLPSELHIERLYETIRFVDANRETEYFKYIEEHFVKELKEKKLFCVLLLNYLLSETDIIFKKKDFNINDERNFGRYITLLKKQLETAENMFWGVRELAKNVENHAKREVSGKWEKAGGRLVIETIKEVILKKDDNSSLWAKYLKSLNNKKIKTKSFLRISLEDNGERGIIETTSYYLSGESDYRSIKYEDKKNEERQLSDRINSCTNQTDKSQLLFDMYFSGTYSFLTKPHINALKGIGLYKFTKFLSKNNGFLNVQTRNNNSTIAFSLFDTLEPKSPFFQLNLFKTDYYVILPLQSPTSEKKIKNKEKIYAEGKELHKSVYEKMLLLEKQDLVDESILNFEDGFNVDYSKYGISEKGKNQNIYVCSFKTANDIDISPLFRLISKVFESNPDKKEAIIINNLSENSIRRLYETYEDIYNDTDNRDKQFFYKNKILLLIDNNNKGIVIAGKTDNECLKINQYLIQYNANFRLPKDITKKNGLTEEETEDIVRTLPQDSLFVEGQLIDIDKEEDRDKKVTFFRDNFEATRKRWLEKDIDEGGYNWKDTHLKIGSKLHLDVFVYGKKMFQRSNEASTFAYLLAKDIFKNIQLAWKNKTPDKKITYTLVGYGHYSELMVSRTCDFLKILLENNTYLENKKYSENADVEYVIVKDEDEIKFSRYFHNLQNREQTLEKLLIIVPISSTLTTCLKIENTFKDTLNDKLTNTKYTKYNKYTESDFTIEQPFYTTIVVVDKGKSNMIPSIQGEVDFENKNITTKNNRAEEGKQNRTNQFNIDIHSEWHLPNNCERCFPPEPIKERPIFVTDKVSVTPSLIFGAPEWYKTEKNGGEEYRYKDIIYKEPYFKFEKDNSINDNNPEELPVLDKISWVHYKSDGNKHFNYYFDYLDFIKQNESKLKNWLSGDVKGSFEKDENKRILLIAPDKAENGRFVHIINREIFDDRASVIRFDKHSDHYLNFNKFFGKDIENTNKDPCSIYFVDNLILSGRTFFAIDEILKTAQIDKKENKIKGIFSLVNRMDYSCFNAVIDKLRDNNNETKANKTPIHFYSFLQLNVLESTVVPCPLCDEEKKYRELRDAASLDCIKEYFCKKEK